jgi:5-formyltetrahydrofolate cyclo-ligase
MPNLPVRTPEPQEAIAEDFLRRRVKSELRKRMRALRKTTPAEACAERSARIVESLLAVPRVAGARTVALFWPIEDRHEVDLRPLDAALRAKGARVAYPALAEAGDMVFHFVADPARMQERGHMFAEPGADDPLVGGDGLDLAELDVIVVPALAIDPSGHRIGYGAGYYDRALARTRASLTLSIGVAYDFQLVSEVPVTAGDVAVYLVVTDRRVLESQEREVTASPFATEAPA